MKKLLATLLVATMLILPTPAIAATDMRVNVGSVTFDEIESYIITYNTQVRSAYDQLNNMQIPSDKTIEGLEEVKRALIEQKEELNGALYDPNLSEDLKTIYYTIYLMTESNIQSIETQISSFKASQSAAIEAHYQATVQTEMLTKQLARAVEQLFVSYHSLGYQIEQMRAQESHLRNQLRAMELYYELGLVSASTVKEIENGLRDLEKGLKTIRDSQVMIKQQLNIMFNQNYDTDLEIGDLPEFDIAVLKEMNLEEDYKVAELKSYSVRLEDDDYYIEAAKRQFQLDFKNGYDKVFDKLESLELEELKLEKLQKDYEFAKLKYELGLLSELKFNEQKLAYDEQKMKVQLAKNDLFLAYRDYQWLKQGVTISSSAAAAQ